MKARKAAAVIFIAAAACTTSGCKKSCETCEEIIAMQSKIAEYRDYFDTQESAEYEGTNENIAKEEDYRSLIEQVNTLSKHECDMPVENVKNKEYSWIYSNTSGTYTGEWKSFGPCGKGVYSGTHLFANGSHYDVEYDGDWEYGVPNGNGRYSGNIFGDYIKSYEGGFVNGRFDGQGTINIRYTDPWTNTITDMYMTISGPFSNGSLADSAEYVVYDGGELFDHGYVNSRYGITQSDRVEQLQEEYYRQTQETMEDIGKRFWDALW